MVKINGKKVIANCQVKPPGWIKKTSKQKHIICTITPSWMIEDDGYTLSLLGEKRYALQTPIKTMIKKGLTVTFGSDSPNNMSAINPFYNLWIAVASNKDGGPASMLPKGENITVKDGIDAYTINAAIQVDDDLNVGSISIGKNADFVILAQDIFEIPISEIKDVKVDATYLQGKPTYLNQESVVSR